MKYPKDPLLNFEFVLLAVKFILNWHDEEHEAMWGRITSADGHVYHMLNGV